MDKYDVFLWAVLSALGWTLLIINVCSLVIALLGLNVKHSEDQNPYCKQAIEELKAEQAELRELIEQLEHERSKSE